MLYANAMILCIVENFLSFLKWIICLMEYIRKTLHRGFLTVLNDLPVCYSRKQNYDRSPDSEHRNNFDFDFQDKLNLFRILKIETLILRNCFGTLNLDFG